VFTQGMFDVLCTLQAGVCHTHADLDPALGFALDVLDLLAASAHHVLDFVGGDLNHHIRRLLIIAVRPQQLIQLWSSLALLHAYGSMVVSHTVCNIISSYM
jgi:hypothetical protein